MTLNATRTIKISVAAATASQCSDEADARDYDVTLTIDGRDVSGAITLWRDKANGGMSAGGAPLDGWCSGSLRDAVDALGLGRGARKVYCEIEACGRSVSGGETSIEVEDASDRAEVA